MYLKSESGLTKHAFPGNVIFHNTIIVIYYTEFEKCEGDEIFLLSMTCCSRKAGGCQDGQGDCDEDTQCANNLICGHNNCPWYKEKVYQKPGKEPTVAEWIIPDCCECNNQYK